MVQTLAGNAVIGRCYDAGANQAETSEFNIVRMRQQDREFLTGFRVPNASSIVSGCRHYARTICIELRGPDAILMPHQGGYLCVLAPAKRTGLQNSGGTPPCGGSFSFDFNARIASGKDANLVAGQVIYGQYWNRDPASSFNTIRTDAISFVICP